MRRIARCFCPLAMLALFASPIIPAAARSISPQEALQYFREADMIWRADGGQLWGVPLGGPLLLVDPQTRIAYANQPDPQGRLRRAGEVLRGEIPVEVNLANTAVEWAGVKWSMLMLPLPEDREVRACLLLHELWHRVQEQLGLPASEAQNRQLDTRDGRYWLQLEWRALAAALAASDANRSRAIMDAAIFRARRRALFPGSGSQENRMELHEGLAEYTGVKLCGAPDPARFVIDHELKEGPARETFVRSFAYASGPAYGLLLDETGRAWRQNLKPTTDLCATLLSLSEIKLPADIPAAAEERARAYDGAHLAAQEDEREKARAALSAGYRARLVDGPVLTIPLRHMQMQFDPGNLVPLDSLGTVYPHIRIVDDWGILDVASHGALLSPDFAQVTVSHPSTAGAESLAGEGWTLQLKAGWSMAPGVRKGDFKLQSSVKP